MKEKKFSKNGAYSSPNIFLYTFNCLFNYFGGGGGGGCGGVGWGGLIGKLKYFSIIRSTLDTFFLILFLFFYLFI